MSIPAVVHDPTELVEACDRARAAGRRVGLIPTMGALHAGHLALVDEARRKGADYLVLTVFVNPLQFGEGEDFDRYPRTLGDDVGKCAERGVDLVFAPAHDAMYPAGFCTHVEVEGLTTVLEGSHRPGHFRGVTTIVAKLFALTAPCIAVFGRKDYQQWRVLDRMARDLDLRVDVQSHPIVREADGLALSSRNRYLTDEERVKGLALSVGLRAARKLFEDGQRDPETLRRAAAQPVVAAADAVDYVAIVNADDMSALTGAIADRALVAVAAHVGKTRLIDNTVLGVEEPALSGAPQVAPPG